MTGSLEITWAISQNSKIQFSFMVGTIILKYTKIPEISRGFHGTFTTN